MNALEIRDWVRVEAVTFWSCSNHFYTRKLVKTGSLLLWKCAWGSCMTKPMDKSSLTSTTDDSRETVWHGDPAKRKFTARRGGDHKGTTKDKPKGEPLTGNSLNANKTILTNWGSSMSMLVGPMQFGGLPMEVLDWARVEVGTYCCLNKEIASTGSLLFGEFASITADRLMQRPLTWTSLASTQRATTGKLFDRLDRTLTQNSRTRGQIRTNQKESR